MFNRLIFFDIVPAPATSNLSSALTAAEVYQATTQGASVEDFFRDWEAERSRPLTGLTPQERRYRHYSRYNWDRFVRAAAAYRPAEDFLRAIAGLEGPQTWLFLTEFWCADAAFSLPVVQSAASASPQVDLRFLFRDEHLGVMERYLTNGARAIPVLVVFDGNGLERVRWGSKPAGLADLRRDMLDQGLDAASISNAAIEWYEDSGWLEVERELIRSFRQAGLGPSASGVVLSRKSVPSGSSD